jgi:rare lipoprotein A
MNHTNISIQQKRDRVPSILLRSTLFITIVLSVLSVSFLGEARDLPPSIRPERVVTTMLDTAVPLPAVMDTLAEGFASWYGGQFHGRRTASGRRFNMHEFTAAHRSLPFGSIAVVQNAMTGKQVVVEITDRGPFIRKRIVDLSLAAAKHVGVSVTKVQMAAVTPTEVALQYAAHNSKVLVVTPEHALEWHDAQRYTLTTAASYSAALKLAGNKHHVAVRPGEGKQLQFFVAEQKQDTLPEAQTLARPFQDSF